MWTHHLPLRRPAISEEIRLQKLAAAKKMLNAFQLRNSPRVPVGVKKKQKIKNGNPELPTICEDVPPNRSAPAPTACEGALAASVPSPDTGIKSHKKLVYEAFPVINWETVVTSRKNDLEGDALNVCNDKTKDLKEKNLQLEKKIQILLSEKEAMQLSREELQKKLELSEARLLQSSSQGVYPYPISSGKHKQKGQSPGQTRHQVKLYSQNNQWKRGWWHGSSVRPSV
jgi:hypothetical protein